MKPDLPLWLFCVNPWEYPDWSMLMRIITTIVKLFTLKIFLLLFLSTEPCCGCCTTTLGETFTRLAALSPIFFLLFSLCTKCSTTRLLLFSLLCFSLLQTVVVVQQILWLLIPQLGGCFCFFVVKPLWRMLLSGLSHRSGLFIAIILNAFHVFSTIKLRKKRLRRFRLLIYG